MSGAFLLFVLCTLVAPQLGTGQVNTCEPECVENAVCNSTNQCECTGNYVWGDGDFRCYKKNQVAAEYRNDPTITNFGNETLQFPYPCRYLITHFKNDLKLYSGSEPIGYCEFEIYGFNTKYDGKIFAHGIDIALKIWYNNGLPAKKLSSRTYGTACNGNPSYTLRGTDNQYYPNGPWGHDAIGYDQNGVTVTRGEDSNGVVVFEAKQCGLLATFTAYDTCLKINQTKIPGISVAVNCAKQPKWLSNDTVIALAPWWMPGGQNFSEIVDPGFSQEASLLVRAYNSSYIQNQPLPNGNCTANPFPDCNTPAKRTKAEDYCLWMLKFPVFMRCLCGGGLSGGGKVTGLFNDCIEAVCTGNTSLCDIVQGQVEAVQDSCNSLANSTIINDFLAHPCPFPV